MAPPRAALSPTRPSFPRNDSAFHRNLSATDREQLLKLQTIRELPKSRYATQPCITVLPSGRARRAVYSHIEIYKMVEDIATNLRVAGVRPQTVCAFALHNGLEAVVYFLALQWIGAIAVPVDPDLSSQQLVDVLRHSRAFTLVSSAVDPDSQHDDHQFNKIRNVCQQLQLVQWHITRSINRGVVLDMGGVRAGQGAAWAGGAADFKFDPSEISIRCAQSPDVPSLQVQLNHRNLASATRTFASIYDLTDEHTTLLLTPFHSIHGLMCVLATMYSGGHVVIPATHDLNPEPLLQIVSKHNVTWFSTSPEHLVDIYDHVETNPSILNGVSLAFVRTIGESLEPDMVRSIEPVLKAPVHEGYGITETCGLITANRELDFRLGTYGRAVPGCEVAIVDLQTASRLASDTEGYIAVSGEHVMKGYSDNDQANRQSFIQIEDDDFEQYFLTGDKGYLTSDGYLIVSKPSSTVAPSESEVRGVEVSETGQSSDEELSMVKKGVVLDVSEEEESERDDDEQVGSSGGTNQDTSSVVFEESSTSQELSTQPSVQSSAVQSDAYTVDRNSDRGVDSREQTPSESSINEELILAILQKLENIERNQAQWEEQVGIRLALEMEKMNKLVRAASGEKQPVASTVLVNMEEINAAVVAAAASAESSSQNCASAANAAKQAAVSAVAAASCAESAVSGGGIEMRQMGDTTIIPPVADANCLQKTILVSLDDVEEAMQLHVSVDIARAFGRPDPKIGHEVFCAIKPKKGARVSEPWLKMHAQSMLPAAFVPRRFFYKDNLSADENRSELSKDSSLKRVSLLSGYSDTRVIKGPAWAPQQST